MNLLEVQGGFWSRRDFLRNAVMFAGAGVTAPLWAAMKYDKNAAMRYFREQASETDARVKAGIEANRKGDMVLVFTDANGARTSTAMRRAGAFRSVASAARTKWRRRATGAPSSASSTSAARIQPP